MNVDLAIQLVWAMAQRTTMTGPEYMMYITLCETVELTARCTNKRLREILGEPQSGTEGST